MTTQLKPGTVKKAATFIEKMRLGRRVHFEVDRRTYSGIVQSADKVGDDVHLTVESLDRFPGCKTLIAMRDANTLEYGKVTKPGISERFTPGSRPVIHNW